MTTNIFGFNCLNIAITLTLAATSIIGQCLTRHGRGRTVSAMKTIIFVLFFVATCYCEVEFSARSRNFSIELLHHTQLQTGGHIVISPFGIWTLVTGIAIGATGETFQQLRSTFILPRTKKTLIDGYKNLTNLVLDANTSGVWLTSKNFLFLDNDFIIYDEFRNQITKDFGAAIEIFDFTDKESAASKANSFIMNSGGRVSNVLTSDDFTESRMILTNVISFRGLWASPFNASETAVEPFYNDNNQVIGEVNMMSQRGQFPFANMAKLKAFVAELPYGNDGKYSMLVMIPYLKASVAETYRSFANVTFKDIYDRLRENEQDYGLLDVDVKLPRFKISTNVVLNKPLIDMGVQDIFLPEVASFTKVTKENIFVSAIVHKADIEVTETGTIASASTSANFADRISTPTIQANKPFLYFIMEKSTTTMIFGGIYSKPSIY